jgi:hypothetical protein
MFGDERLFCQKFSMTQAIFLVYEYKPNLIRMGQTKLKEGSNA